MDYTDAVNYGEDGSLVFLGITVPCSTRCFLALPETKGRTFEQLDLVFERKVLSK